MKKAVKSTKAKTAQTKPRTKSAAEVVAEEAFRRATVVRGDAAPLKNGKLPAGATFEVEGVDETGVPLIKRNRFSIS